MCFPFFLKKKITKKKDDRLLIYFAFKLFRIRTYVHPSSHSVQLHFSTFVTKICILLQYLVGMPMLLYYSSFVIVLLISVEVILENSMKKLLKTTLCLFMNYWMVKERNSVYYEFG